MTFGQYLKDKRYFLLLYAAMMTFVAGIVLLSVEPRNAWGNIAYMQSACLLMAAAYLLIGYRFRSRFYKELEVCIGSGLEAASLLPEPQTGEQSLYLDLLRKWERDHAGRIQLLQREKKEHQDFVLSWIHEIKLPIAGSRLIMENAAGKSAEVVVDKLEDELGKIDHYVEQALYASRIDTFSRDYLIGEEEMGRLVKDSVKKYAKLFIAKRIRLAMPEDSFTVHSDRKWLQYIVDQLVSNALKYTEEGGEIAVRYEEDTREKRLYIRDTGIGIKPEDLQRVFDRGFTGATGRQVAKSTGMGLYLAKQLALKLGHDLSIVSEEGKYTVAAIHFPKVRQ